MSEAVPTIWRESFGYFSDDSLHLLSRLYLSNSGLQKKHSRELIVEALWHHANRKEFNRKSLSNLNSFDTKILLLMYLGMNSIQQFADSLSECSPIEICLQLLHLQERMLVLLVAPKSKSTNRENRDILVHLIPKIEKQLQSPEGGHFIIAPQFMASLRQRLDFCTLFCGLALPSLYNEQDASIPKLLLSSELLLASALYFAQEAFTFKRKINKIQLAKCRDCFPHLNDEQLQQLRQFSLACGLLGEGEQHQVLFLLEAFERLWRAPYYQRLLSLQAYIAELNPASFAKLLSIWPQNVLLPGKQLQRLLSLLGKPHTETASCIQTMQCWHIVLEITEAIAPSQTLQAEEGPYYLLNPRLYDSIMDAEGPAPSEPRNRLSSNWEFYCDLCHPDIYIELLLCARLEHFSELSLFRIEKSLFQQYFNAESNRFEHFLRYLSQLEHCGIHVSELIRQQWQEWFSNSTRFQLFKNCLLVCQPSYNELISHLLDFKPIKSQTKCEVNTAESSNVLCNPQPGVFYLKEEHYQHWRNKLVNAGIQLSEPFSAPKPSGPNSVPSPIVKNFEFPIEQVWHQWQAVPGAPSCSEDSPHIFPWDSWPTNPQSFVESRQLVCSNTNLSQLHIHFREARGVDYTAKRNLLHSLLIARNHMAIITVAEGDNFDLVPYIVLPLSLYGPKEDPYLLTLDLRHGCLLQFCVRNITRVHEVFYSLINVCLLGLLPSGYISALEAEFQHS